MHCISSEHLLVLLWLLVLQLCHIGHVCGDILVLEGGRSSYPDKAASFGPQLDAQGLEAFLVPLEDVAYATGQPDDDELLYGCRALTRDEQPGDGLKDNWIALVKRGRCAFAQKVRAMQQSGALGVIVGDDKPNGPLLTMYSKGDTSDIRIPSAFVAGWEYSILKFLASETLLSLGDAITMDWSVQALQLAIQLARLGPSQLARSSSTIASLPALRVRLVPGKAGGQLETLDLVIIFFFAPLLFFSILALIWYNRRFQRDVTPSPHAATNNTRILATQTQVLRLPRVPFHPFLDEPLESQALIEIGDSGTCTICLDDYRERETLIELPKCGHLFHPKCIFPWLLNRSRLCPICKMDSFISPLMQLAVPSPPGSLDEQLSICQSDDVSSSSSSSYSSPSSDVESDLSIEPRPLTCPPPSSSSSSLEALHSSLADSSLQGPATPLSDGSSEVP